MPVKSKKPSDPHWPWKPGRRFRPRPTLRKSPKGTTPVCFGWYSKLADGARCRRAGCKHPAHQVVRVYPRKPETKRERLRDLRAIRAFVERRAAQQWKYFRVD